MRFIANGPNIPDELLYAQDEGNVVFFCGAGVSMAHAYLPSFANLAQKVMGDLGVTDESKELNQYNAFIELNKDTHTRGLISADTIFSSLKRSFNNDNLNRSVANCLKPNEDPNLVAHKTILKLARIKSGETRLITTNFDLLFEECNKKLKSVTRSNLPRIEYSNNDWGIVHLHGKVNSDYSAPTNDGFVLSSSEFGDAYLAQGWARDFVKDVLEKFVAVFIGYSADDPPVRYLLEGLKQGNGFKHKIYAFQSGPNDEAVAQWSEKGVEAIVYELDEGRTSHSPLWKTLDAWGDRSKNPTEWKKKVLARSRRGPAKLAPHERGMIAHLVKSQSGAKSFCQFEPSMSAEWLCVFDPLIRLKQIDKDIYSDANGELINPYQLYSLDDDPPPSGRNKNYKQIPSKPWDAFALNDQDYESLKESQLPKIRGMKASEPAVLPARLSLLAEWIVIVSEQLITAWWVGQQISLHPDVLKKIKYKITNNSDASLSKELKKSWNIIFEINNYANHDDHEAFLLQRHIDSTGWSNYAVREYARISAPYLKLRNFYVPKIPRSNGNKPLNHSHIYAEVDYPKYLNELIIPNEYIAPVINNLRINLEKAVDMETEFSYLQELCAIEPDDDIEGQNYRRDYGLDGYVLQFVSLFKTLVTINKEASRSEFMRWRNNDPIFSRLRLWASGLKEVATPAEFTEEILALKQEIFYSYKGERDLLLALNKRWGELSLESRVSIEKKILKSPKRYKKTPKSTHLENSATIKLNRLHWLKNQGCELSFNLTDLTNKLRVDAPEWKPEYAQKAAVSHDGRSGFIRTNTDWTSLKSIPISKIIEIAKKSKVRDFDQFVEHEPFAGLCDDAPLKAIGALTLEFKKNGFSKDLWETYLSRECRKKDQFRLKLLTSGRIIQIPDEKFISIILTTSRWFEDVGPELREKNIKIYEDLWNKFINVMTLHQNAFSSAFIRQKEKEIDWPGEAINSPSGNLAELHMKEIQKKVFEPKIGLPKEWLSKVDQLIDLPNDFHRYAMVIFAFNLSWFHNIDPIWTERKLIKILEDDTAERNDKDAIWAGFMWGARTPDAELFIKLKPHLLKMAREDSPEKKGHIEVLSGILLSGWGTKNKSNERFVSDEELRNVLLNSGDNFRSHTLWHLGNWSKETNGDWNNNILEFLQNVWPKHKKVRTSKTSARLCEIALSQKNNFPAISKVVSQLVSKIENENLFIPEIRKSGNNEHENGENLASIHPDDFLNLLYAILPDQPERWPYGTNSALDCIEKANPKLSNDPRLIDLKSRL